jgi:hypothetical protein
MNVDTANLVVVFSTAQIQLLHDHLDIFMQRPKVSNQADKYIGTTKIGTLNM